MVSRNRLRKAKTLWTENPEGELLTFYTAEDEEEEARFVVQKDRRAMPALLLFDRASGSAEAGLSVISLSFTGSTPSPGRRG